VADELINLSSDLSNSHKYARLPNENNKGPDLQSWLVTRSSNQPQFEDIVMNIGARAAGGVDIDFHDHVPRDCLGYIVVGSGLVWRIGKRDAI